MSNDTSVKLAKAVYSVRGQNTAAWNEFMAALSMRLDDITEEMVAAPADRLQLLQGRAQEIRALFAELTKAPQLAQQLYDKERGHGSTTAPR
jgi:flagellar hook-basal body complex protein FliE